MRICLDFDGVLHDAAHPVPGRKMGPPMPNAVYSVHLLQRDGHDLVVHSARIWEEGRADHVWRWLHYWGFPSLPVSVAKPVADVYVDDKGLRFQGWEDALLALSNHDSDGRLRAL